MTDRQIRIEGGGEGGWDGMLKHWTEISLVVILCEEEYRWNAKTLKAKRKQQWGLGDLFSVSVGKKVGERGSCTIPRYL